MLCFRDAESVSTDTLVTSLPVPAVVPTRAMGSGSLVHFFA